MVKYKLQQRNIWSDIGFYSDPAVMYLERDWFVIPLTGNICGNQVATNANLSPLILLTNPN